MAPTLSTELHCAVRGEYTASRLHVDRTDISFRNVSAQTVRIEVTVRNLADTPTEPTKMTLQAAPLGAFVPWQELTTVTVPSLSPRESKTMVVHANRPKLDLNATFDQVVPAMLVGTDMLDDPEAASGHENRRSTRSRRSSSMGAARNSAALKILQTLFSFEPQRRASGELALPYDPMDLRSATNAHWAGNLNVHMNNTAVERHMAQALRIYPDRANLALFLVGAGGDEYKFGIAKSNLDWEVQLYQDHGVRGQHPAPLNEDSWCECEKTLSILLAVRPPEFCNCGTVNIEVTQRSNNQKALVEFSMDPDAAGPGCYTV